MGRKSHWPPRVTRHAASGQDRVRHDGKTVYLGPSGSAEARQAYAELLARLTPKGEAPAARWLTLAEVTSRWVVERGPSHAPTERASYLRAIEALLLNGRAILTADRLDVSALAAARKDMLTLPWRDVNGRERAGWCRNVVNRQVVRLRTVWRWAEETGLAPPGSWSHLRTLRALPAHDRGVRQTQAVKPATWEDVQAVARHVRSRAVKAMLLVQWWAGCRSGEVRDMRGDEVDRSADDWVYRPSRHKNAWRGQERVIVLGPKAREAMAALLPLPEGFVFTDRKGEPYTSSAYAGMLARAARKAGLSWFRPLCLRHGARLRITREVSLDAARAVLGHVGAAMTAHYAKGVDVEAARQAARQAG